MLNGNENESGIFREIGEIYNFMDKLKATGWKRVVIASEPELFRLIPPNWSQLYKSNLRGVPFSPITAALWISGEQALAGKDNNLPTEPALQEVVASSLRLNLQTYKLLEEVSQTTSQQNPSLELLRKDLEEKFPIDEALPFSWAKFRA